MKNIDRILNGDYEKCHYPFFWLRGGETVDDVVKAVERVYDAGCNGITVESREYPDFDKTWWELMDAIIQKTHDLGMRIFVVDEDSFCPTGHAFGLVNKPENAHLKRASVVEDHLDVIGPKNVDIVINKPLSYIKTTAQDVLLGCFAYKRTDREHKIDISNPIDLTSNISNGILSWDIPEGAYRIEFVYSSSRYAEIYKDDFIDMCTEEGVDLLINSIYEEYERRYKKYFGNTFMGFFSDEPNIGNCYPYYDSIKYNMYSEDCKIGKLGLSLPYNSNIKNKLDAIYGKDVTPMLVALWYWDENVSPEFRSNYMNVVADLYKTCFTDKLGAWCKKRGLLYIGHVLEDKNLHSRLGSGAAHYFRSQNGQDYAGIDVVLGQVQPGFSDMCRSVDDVLRDNEFYHYILGKFNSSAAHTYSQFNGKAFCEATIGYGWAEGTQLAKWLFDFFLVRGTNFFVPGAIRPIALDNIHSPHWGDNEGKDPQGKGYAKLLDYSKKVITCLDKSQHVANVAILYNAQGEWMSDEAGMFMQKPAKLLYDNHIDFDILCEDLLKGVQVVYGKCKVIETYDLIVVPYAQRLPEWVQNDLLNLKNQGADIVFVDGLPVNKLCDFTVVPLPEIANYCISKGYVDVKVESFHQLRHYHCQKDGEDIYMFFNESSTKTFEGEIYTGKQGNYNVYDFITDKYYQGRGGDKVFLTLKPYQSAIVVYEKERGFKPYACKDSYVKTELNVPLNVKLFYYENKDVCFKDFKMDKVQAISKLYPNFSGEIRYEFEFKCLNIKDTLLKFDEIGENAQVFVNGKDCGFAICNPFIFDVSNAVVKGINKVKVIVYTTLANAIKDANSMMTPMARTGISGKITLLERSL